MNEIYQANVNERYKSLYSIYLGKKILKEGLLEAGQVTVVADYEPPIDKNEDTSLVLTCGLNANNSILSGLKKLYTLGVLSVGDNPYEVIDKHSIRFTKKIKKPLADETFLDTGFEKNPSENTSIVFERKNLKHIHIEPFRPENLSYWEPKSETDIYMAWGILQEYTGYKYCCGTTIALLRDLGYEASNDTKPDAILINDATNCYEIAEMKIRSSDFDRNHKKEDIDVLVVWHDDEQDRSKLPGTVIELYQTAKDALNDIMDED